MWQGMKGLICYAEFSIYPHHDDHHHIWRRDERNPSYPSLEYFHVTWGKGLIILDQKDDDDDVESSIQNLFTQIIFEYLRRKWLKMAFVLILFFCINFSHPLFSASFSSFHGNPKSRYLRFCIWHSSSRHVFIDHVTSGESRVRHQKIVRLWYLEFDHHLLLLKVAASNLIDYLSGVLM